MFIHASKLGSHGRLKSSNCLVDNRWTLKLTDYSIGPFLEGNDPSQVSVLEEHEQYKSIS